MDARSEFREFCASHQLDPGSIEPGRVVRFHVDGDRKGKKNGYYLFYEDGTPNGFVGTWKEGVADRRKWRAGAAVERLDRSEIDRRRDERRRVMGAEKKAGAEKAKALWESAAKINGASHPYLDRKGIAPHGARIAAGRVVVPVIDAEDEIISAQTIAADGEKRFQPGSSMAGGYFRIGKEADGLLIFCEGYSTGATVHQATGCTVIICFNGDNMVAVARWAGHRWAGRSMVVAGDDDRHLVEVGKANKGRDCAEAAARILGCGTVFPDMQGAEGSDFNDQAAQFGIESVAAALSSVRPAPAPEISVVPSTTNNKQPLPIEWGEEIEPQLSGLWLIKRFLTQSGLALIYGHPGSGKSFLAIDIAMHVALGWEWNGRLTKKGLVVYIGAEGQNGLRNRIVAFRRQHGLKGPLPFALIPCPVDLQAAGADTPRVADAVHLAVQRYGEKPALIVVDTISKTFGAGKENTDDMATYVANCGRLAAEFNCCVMPVHHRPKDAESTEPRGHGSLKGGVDTVILVEAGKTKKATVTKQKDAPDGDQVLFNLLPVDLGSDEDGELVTSCIVQPTGIDSNVPTDPRRRLIQKLSDRQRIVYTQIGEAVTAHGVAVPEAIPIDVIDRNRVGKVVSLNVFSDRSISALRTSSDGKPDSARRSFERARDKLQSLEIIKIWEDWAWLTFE